jgi:hypothetical protein
MRLPCALGGSDHGVRHSEPPAERTMALGASVMICQQCRAIRSSPRRTMSAGFSSAMSSLSSATGRGEGRKPPFGTVKRPARPYKKKPYKADLLCEALRAPNRPGRARTVIDGQWDVLGLHHPLRRPAGPSSMHLVAAVITEAVRTSASRATSQNRSTSPI